MKLVRIPRSLKIIGVVAMASMIQGCGMKVDLWGAKIDFPEGLDVGGRMNSIDTVTDHRGVNSKDGSYSIPHKTREVYNGN